MTPKSIVLITAVCISLLLSSCVLVLSPELGWIKAVLFFILASIVCYGAIFFVTRKYLYKRLLPIYRTILGMTSNKSDLKESAVMGTNLEDTKNDVLHWADERIKEIRSLQAQDNFRREFIGNLAHELKTPLFNIQGYTSSLLEGAMEDVEVREKFLIKANRNIERMTRIVEDLDTISHLEAEGLQLEIKPIDLIRCAKEIIESAEKRAQEKSISITLESKPDLKVMGDEFRIGQVLTNLINNAIIYGREGGFVNIGFTDFDDRILVEVRDNGPGIKAEYIPRLFERFYRVDASRSRDVGGTGLGLSIVKHILEAHGQSVSAKSEVGKGSTFSFTLAKAR